MVLRSHGFARFFALVTLIASFGAASVAAAAAPAAPANPLAPLAWMAGSWVGDIRGLHMEEHWSAANGGLMSGMHRDLKGGRVVSFEFLRVVARGDSLVYVSLPNGRNETPFPMKEVSGKRVVFENPEHDFPQRIIYWQSRPNTLSARVEGMMNGRLESEEWTWTRGNLGR